MFKRILFHILEIGFLCLFNSVVIINHRLLFYLIFKPRVFCITMPISLYFISHYSSKPDVVMAYRDWFSIVYKEQPLIFAIFLYTVLNSSTSLFFFFIDKLKLGKRIKIWGGTVPHHVLTVWKNSVNSHFLFFFLSMNRMRLWFTPYVY